MKKEMINSSNTHQPQLTGPKTVFARFNIWLIHHSLIMFIASILFIGISLLFASKLTLESNMEDMLPSDSLILKQTQLFNEYFPSNETAIVVVEGDAIEASSFLTGFEETLTDVSYISSMLFYMDMSSLGDDMILYKDDEFYETLDVYLNSMDIVGLTAFLSDLESDTSALKEYFVESTSQGNRMYLIFLKPNFGEDFVESRDSFYNGVSEAIRDTQMDTNTAGLNVGLTGGAFIQDIEGDAVAFNGLFSTFLFTLIFILLFILLAFNKILLPLSTGLPLIGGAIVAAAFAFIIYGSLNMFSISFAILLLGLGIDFGVHIISRYQEERKSYPKKQALLNALNNTGSSIIFGAITTALAFFAFSIAKFKAFEQMGVISGFGILFLCIMMFTMIPGLILFFDRDTDASTTKRVGRFGIKALTKSLITLTVKRPFAMPIITLIIILILIPSILSTKIIGDISKIYPADLPSILLATEVQETFDYNTNTVSTYASSYDNLVRFTTQLEASNSVEETNSILDFIPTNQPKKLKILDKLSLLDSSYRFNEITVMDLDPNIRENFIGKDNRYLIEIIPSKDIYDPINYDEIKHTIKDISGLYPVGMPVIMNEIVLLVTSDIILISIVCIAIIFILLLFIYRNIIDCMITLMPLLLSLYTTIGMMNLLNIDINIFSIAAFPLIIGIGIDSSIHLMHRLKESLGTINIADTANTGQAIFITTTTTIIGFSSLTRINHPGIANLGLAVSIGMFVCIIYTLLLLPALYQLRLRLKASRG